MLLTQFECGHVPSYFHTFLFTSLNLLALSFFFMYIFFNVSSYNVEKQLMLMNYEPCLYLQQLV